MANKIVERMMEEPLKQLARDTGIPRDKLKRIILSGDGQRASLEDAVRITKALNVRSMDSLWVNDEGSGKKPRVRG